MPVVATHSEYRCKLCRHDKRPEIDALLERRSRREKDREGRLINEQYVIARLREWDVPNPTRDNLNLHWKKHCEVISDEVVAEATKNVTEALELLGERLLTRDLGPDTLTDDLIEIAQVSLREQVAKGVMPKVTIDQALKAIDTKTRRKHNDRVNALLDVQAEALTQSLGFHRPAELEAGEVLDDDEA